MTIRYKYVQKMESIGEVSEGLAYLESHQAEAVEFAIKADENSAKICVKIERGAMAMWDVASVIDTQFPDFERINKCQWRLEEYKMEKKELPGEFLQAYNALHKLHEIVIGTTEKAIRELKEAMK